MPVKVFYMPFNSRGITRQLFGEALKNVKGPDYSGILYMAPSSIKIRDAQHEFSCLAGDCYVPPEMVTLRQFSKRMFSRYGDRKIIHCALIPVVLSKLSGRGIGFSSAIAQFMGEIKQYHTEKDMDSVGRELNNIFNGLGIPEEVSHRSSEAFSIIGYYQKLLDESSAIDEYDCMSLCPAMVGEHNIRYSVLILDGFYDPTPAEKAIIKQLMLTAKDVLIAMPYNTKYSFITSCYNDFIINNFKFELPSVPQPRDFEAPSFYSYPGIEDEIEGIARSIKNFFISGKIKNLNKTCVVFPKLTVYSDMLTRIFKKYGIPHALSSRKPLGETKPFKDLLALLDSVSDDYPRIPFSQFLVSPFFRKLPQSLRQQIPRISLLSGIVKGKEAWLSLRNSGGASRKPPAGNSGVPACLQKELQWVFKKLSPLESIKNKGTYGEYCGVITELLDELDFSGLSDEKREMKETVAGIFRELSFIDTLTLSGPAGLRDFTDSMKLVLNATGTEAEAAGVQVMSVSDMHGLEPEHLYFGGLKDGDLPSKPDIDHLLPDSVRTRFGLRNLGKYLLLQKFAFWKTIESAHTVHLSYPSMEGDKSFLPSPFLHWDKEVKHHVYGIFSVEEDLILRGKTPLSSYICEIKGIGAKAAGRMFGEDSFIRVTDIDSYRACPRKFYLERVLCLEPPEIKKYEIEAMLLGTIAHEIMQALLSKGWQEFEDLPHAADTAVDRIVSLYGLEEYWKKVIRDTFVSIIPDICKIERKIRAEGFAFMDAEVAVEGEIIRGIKLRGKIDRIDKKAGHGAVEIIDYKTGPVQFSGQQVISKGATLQLFLYAALMKSMGFHVDRAGIYSLKDVRLSWIPGRNDRKEGRSIDEYISACLRYLGETVAKMRDGVFTADPIYELTCRNCPERPYCPYIQKSQAFPGVMKETA